MLTVWSRHRKAVLTESATIGEAIGLHAALQGERPAMVASGFEPLTYAALDEEIKAIGAVYEGWDWGPVRASWSLCRVGHMRRSR